MKKAPRRPSKPAPEPRKLTTAEAAEDLGTSRRIVQRLIKQGRLPAVRWGRDYMILEPDLDKVRDRPYGRPQKYKSE